MTNEEAKDWLKIATPIKALTQEEFNKFIEAVNKAIDLLEQSNSDEDCISRKDAEMCLTADITDMTIEEYISMVGDRIKGLSSVQPKPKYVAVGNVNFDKDELQKIVDEAIPTIMPEIKYRKAHWQNNACSNCGIYNASAYKNWCPNCGCQMTEETE